jgi:pimeloyl-ACP methyl ester carboxylesterase
MVPNTDPAGAGADDATGEPTPDPFRGEDGDPVIPDGWTHGTVDANGITVSYYRAGPVAEDASPTGEEMSPTAEDASPTAEDTSATAEDASPTAEDTSPTADEAPTVVVAHGFFEDARCKRQLVDALAADGVDVVAYDARGHGHSDAPETGYAPADRVADLLGVLDALDLEDPVLYGHSMGGSTVAKAAAEHPARVAGVVMEDPAGLRWPPEFDLDDVADDLIDDVREDLAKSFDELLDAYEEIDDEPASAADEIPPALYATFARSDQRQSEHVAEITRQGHPALDHVFPAIDVPTLVLRRDQHEAPDAVRDGSPTAERAKDLEIAATLPNGRLVHVPGAGHHVVLTAEDAALTEIRAFLQHTVDGYEAPEPHTGGGGAGDDAAADHVDLENAGSEDDEMPSDEDVEADGPGLPSGPLSVTYRDDGRPARLDDRDGSTGADWAPADWESGTVETNGVELAYYRTGPREERTIVFAHGFSSGARTAREHVETFASDHDVIAYDSRGHGFSAAPETGYCLDDRVADLGGLLDALDLADVVLYGHSMNGSTVGAAADEYPERVAGVVMEEPGLVHGWPNGFTPEEFADLQRSDVEAAHSWPLEDLAALLTEDFPDLFEDHPERADRAARAFHRTSTHAARFALDDGDELGERLEEIAVPALCLGGDWPVAWRADDLETESQLPNGRFVHLPGAGHNAFLTAPEIAEREVRAFLARLDDRDRSADEEP